MNGMCYNSICQQTPATKTRARQRSHAHLKEMQTVGEDREQRGSELSDLVQGKAGRTGRCGSI